MPPTPIHSEVFQALASASEMVKGLETRVNESLGKFDRAIEKYDARDERREDRVRKLENWQSWMMGIGAVVSLLMGVLVIVSAGIIVEEVKAVPAQIRAVVHSEGNSAVH